MAGQNSNALADLIADIGPIAVLDGGFATCLEENHHIKMHRQLWSAFALLTNPDTIEQVHKEYLESGADIIETSSYQASYQGFESACGKTPEEVDELLQLSVRLARQAVDKFMEGNTYRKRRPLVAASIGPHGAVLPDGAEFHGRYVETMTKQQLKDFHRRRVKVLSSEPGVDLLAFETVPSSIEADAIGELLAEEHIQIPAWVSFSCKDSHLTCHGESFYETVRDVVLKYPQFVAVGINCTAPKFVRDLAADAQRAMHDSNVTKYIIAYPNKGERFDPESQSWVPSSEEGSLHDCIDSWISLGVSIIGGCCRTRPDDIVKVSNAVKRK